MHRVIVYILLISALTACSSIGTSIQRPAPHNDFTGRYLEKHFSNEDANDYMIRACKVYGGLNQESVQKKESDLFLQNIF